MHLDVATVITSLATVLPVVGKTVVSWLWGGQQKASLEKPCLMLGLAFFNVIGNKLNPARLNSLQRGYREHNIKYVCCYFMNNYISQLFQNKVKIQWSRVIFDNAKPYVRLAHIHLIAKSAGPFRLFSSLNGAQRLNARDLMWLVGLVEGDGSFSVNKNGKYVKYEFSIEIHVNDVKLLYQIKSMLGNYGSIVVHKRTNTTIARLKISSKKDLKGIVLPIFDKYSLLTSKQYDYLYFRQCLLRNIIFFDDLPNYQRPAFTPFNYMDPVRGGPSADILKLHYYDAWLVGFINAKGYFGTYKPDASRRGCFEIGQTDELQTLESIKKRLNISSKGPHMLTPISEPRDIKSRGAKPRTAPPQGGGAVPNPAIFDRGGRSRKMGPQGAPRKRGNVNKDKANCYKLATSSKRSIENIIKFLKYNPVKLKGLKRAQYLKWLHELRDNPLYYDLNIPNSY
jgi:ubiquinol-cytochrome c reductase cytochrome b subunit